MPTIFTPAVHTRLAQMKARHAEVETELNALHSNGGGGGGSGNAQRLAALSKELAELGEVVDLAGQLEGKRSEVGGVCVCIRVYVCVGAEEEYPFLSIYHNKSLNTYRNNTHTHTGVLPGAGGGGPGPGDGGHGQGGSGGGAVRGALSVFTHWHPYSVPNQINPITPTQHALNHTARPSPRWSRRCCAGWCRGGTRGTRTGG